MERIAYLIKELNNLHQNDASSEHLIGIVNELQILLQQEMLSHALPEKGKRIAFLMPADLQPAPRNIEGFATDTPPLIKQEEPEEKVYELLEVDEAELEAELEEIRKKAEFNQKLQAKQAQLKPGILFDFDDEEETPALPTLVHQKRNSKPVNETKPVTPEETPVKEDVSLNESLRQDTNDVVQFLEKSPIKDLRKAVGINEKYQYINELFRGDEDMYERSIKTINNFSAYGEAHYWIERELKVKIGWDMTKQVTKDFYSLVKRRFS
jgi:hypothetical protein